MAGTWDAVGKAMQLVILLQGLEILHPLLGYTAGTTLAPFVLVIPWLSLPAYSFPRSRISLRKIASIIGEKLRWLCQLEMLSSSCGCLFAIAHSRGQPHHGARCGEPAFQQENEGGFYGVKKHDILTTDMI